MDIMRHKDAVDGIVKTGQAIMNSKDEEEKQALKVKKSPRMEWSPNIHLLLVEYLNIADLW